MQFNWQKKGLIFDPRNRFEWMKAYSQVPTILDKGDLLRIFFTCRPAPQTDGSQISLISYIDVDKDNPSNIIYIHRSTVLELGDKGAFDEFGLHPCFFLEHKGQIMFYYQGWTRLKSVPYITSLGLAISNDGGNSFKKYASGPIFSRRPNEPFLENGFFAIKQNEVFYMWYATCKEWLDVNGKLEPVYNIVQARSTDGIEWERNGEEIFQPRFEKEASGRPCVIEIDGVYHMWFCYRDVLDFRNGRNGAYRIGYASSYDLRTWTRNDDLAGIDVSEEGWDSEMIAYPFVYRNGNQLYLFYNGNEFGKSGFGYAVCNLN